MSNVFDFSRYQKKIAKKKIPQSEKDRVGNVCEEIMFDLVQRLDNEGFNVRDPDLLLDLEVVTRVLLATMSRQRKLESKSIKELNKLRGMGDEEDS